jgi:hypothetical protein
VFCSAGLSCLRELLADGVWHWTYEDSDESSPVLDDIMRHINFCTLQRYTEKRDNVYRADAELPPKWEGINPNLAYSCLPSDPTNTQNSSSRLLEGYGTNHTDTGPTVSRVFSTLLKPLRPPSVYYAIVWKIRLTFIVATNILSCVDCEKPPSTYKLGHSQGFALILDVLHGRDPSSGSFTKGPSLTDMIELRPAGMVHSIHLIFSHFSAGECLPRSQSPSPSSKNFASASLNSFPHSQKRQFRWKHCNSSPVFELPSDISPPVFVDAPPLPSLHPSFRQTTSANVLPSNRPLRCSSTPPPSRNPTQTYFKITSSGSDAVTRSSVSLRTIPFQ